LKGKKSHGTPFNGRCKGGSTPTKARQGKEDMKDERKGRKTTLTVLPVILFRGKIHLVNSNSCLFLVGRNGGKRSRVGKGIEVDESGERKGSPVKGSVFRKKVAFTNGT